MPAHPDLECKQAVPIAKLEITTDQISKTLERLSTVLETIATQRAELDALTSNQEVLFERLRKVELSLSQILGGAVVASAVVSALVGLLLKLFK